MATSISSLLTTRRIHLSLAGASAVDAILETAQLIQKSRGMVDFDGFCRDVILRESQVPTVMGNGVAFPHARTDCVDRIIMAVGRSTEGVWFKGGKQRTHLLFLIGTPRNITGEYLALMSMLSRLVRDPGILEKLLHAETPQQFLRCLPAKI